ncbi:MAG: FtsX-like permease family protein [Lachnospiraceae bacterium]|nr:FtsX-like permease family protein [Lachnospiraceae bacterium]
MRDLNLIIKGNFRKNKAAYITVFILMFIVSVCFVTVLSVVNNTKKHNQKAMEDTGLGDMLIWCGEYNFENFEEAKTKFNEKLSDCNVISEAKAIDVIETYIPDINGTDYGNTVFIIDYKSEQVSYKIYDKDDNLVTSPHLNKGEIIVPISFKVLFDVNIGDTFAIGRGDDTLDVKIAYFFEDPYMGTYLMGIKTLLISDEDISYIKDNFGGYAYANSVLYSLKKSDSKMKDIEFEKRVNRDTNISAYAWITITKNECSTYMMMMVNIFSGILLGFIIMLVIIAIIVLGHNISNSIEKDYVNYGIYKAIGITNSKLKISIMCGYILTCIIGFIAGVPVAIPLIKVVNKILRPVGGTYVESKADMVSSTLAMLLILFFVGIYIMIKVARISRVTPVMALNDGRKNVHFSSILKLPVSKRFLNTSLAYRQLISRKKQYISAVIITAFLVVFMVLINQMLSWMSGGDAKIMTELFEPVAYNMVVSGEKSEDLEAKKDEINDLIANESEYKIIHATNQYVLLDDSKISCQIIDNPEAIGNIVKGRTCLYDNEILMTEYLSKELGVGIGDTVVVGDHEEKEDYIITGLTASGNDAGKSFIMNFDGYERLAKDVEWTWRVAYYVVKDEDKVDDIVELINGKYGDLGIKAEREDYDMGNNPISVAVKGISVVIYTLSAIFIMITVILVSGKMFEREKKDYGILKACGFDVGKLRSQFAVRFMIASFAGSLLGIIIALLSGEKIIEMIFSMFGVMHIDLVFGAPALIIPVCVVALMFYVFAYLVSRRIKKVSTRVLVVE